MLYIKDPQRLPQAYLVNNGFSREPPSYYYTPDEYCTKIAIDSPQYNNLRKIPWELKKLKYHDIIFAWLFWATVGGFVALSVIYLKKVMITQEETIQLIRESYSSITIKSLDIIGLFGAVIIQSLTLCFLLLGIIFIFSKFFLVLGIIVNITLGISLCIYTLKEGNMGLSVISMFFTMIMACMFWKIRSRIKFSARILKIVVSVIQKFPCIWVVFFTSFIFIGLFAIFFILVLMAAYVSLKNEQNQTIVCSVFLYLAFSGYYITEALKNSCQVSVSVIFSKWYYKSEVGVFKALNTVIIRCFGSICFGSLLVTSINLVRDCLSLLKHNSLIRTNAIMLFFIMIIDFIISIVEWLTKYFNDYAYAYMAIHCNGYFRSSTKVYKILAGKGFESMTNDCIINTALNLYLLFVGFTGGISAYVYLSLISTSAYKEDYPFLVFIIAISFLISLQIGRMINIVITAGVHTFFICLAEKPEIFVNEYPKEYELFKKYPTATLAYTTV